MRVHIGKIKGKRGAYLEFSFRESLPSPWEMDAARLDGPVDFSGRVTNTGKGYLVEGVVQAGATLTCDRCLEPFKAEIEGEVREEFHSEASVSERRRMEDQGKDDDEASEPEEWNLFKGETFSLDEVVRDHLVLALPPKFLCRAACKGMCSRCGQNLNEADCACPTDDVDPRMAALLDLFKSDQ